jgi:hypothetical protein
MMTLPLGNLAQKYALTDREIGGNLEDSHTPGLDKK